MFHLQLRQFPHNHCQFNLSEQDLARIVTSWADGGWISIGERRWSPHQARLTIIEGPQLALASLSMGRGWRQVQREGQDVTQRLLEHASATPPHAPAGRAPSTADVAAAGAVSAASVSADDPSRTGVQLRRPVGDHLNDLLGDGRDAAALLEAWRSVTARSPQLSPSERLALAELQLRTSRADPSG